MRLVRILLYALAALVDLYVLAVVLYVIPMVGGLIDDTMAVRPLASSASGWTSGVQRCPMPPCPSAAPPPWKAPPPPMP
jgi:hypothetical protein